MNSTTRVLLAVCSLSTAAAAQFQSNGSDLALRLDGHGGSPMTYASALRGPCQPVGFRVDVAPRLQGMPMVLFASTADPIGKTGGALRTAGGQWLNLDPSRTVALPAMSATSFEAALALAAPASLSVQALVLDSANPDGFRLSGPTHYRSAADTVVVTRPSILGGKPGGLAQVALDGMSSPFGDVRDTPMGLAFDGRGTTWYGRARSHSPLIIDLFERGRDGTERNLGPVVNTSGGAYALGANGFDLLWLGDRLAFTHPEILSHSGSGGSPGAIRTIDPRTGSIDTLVGGLASPSGLALADNGDLYYGVVESHPFRIDVYRRTPNGETSRVVRAYDGSRGHYPVGVWAFDLAVQGDRLVFNLPSAFDPFGGSRRGSIDEFDLRTGQRSVLIPALDFPSGLSFDAQGGLYYGEASFSPARARLFHRAAGAARSTDLGEIFNKTGGHLALGLWGLDVVVPCR